MIVYKLKHIPTGLYFNPSRGHHQCNLSKTGRSYNKRPLIRVGSTFYDLDCQPKTFIAKEWIIEEHTVKKSNDWVDKFNKQHHSI